MIDPMPRVLLMVLLSGGCAASIPHTGWPEAELSEVQLSTPTEEEPSGWTPPAPACLSRMRLQSEAGRHLLHGCNHWGLPQATGTAGDSLNLASAEGFVNAWDGEASCWMSFVIHPEGELGSLVVGEGAEVEIHCDLPDLEGGAAVRGELFVDELRAEEPSDPQMPAFSLDLGMELDLLLEGGTRVRGHTWFTTLVYAPPP